MSEISDSLAAELAALADGTLDPRRGAKLRRELERSPERNAAFEDQRVALASIALASEASASDSLHEAIAGSAAAASRRQTLSAPGGEQTRQARSRDDSRAKAPRRSRLTAVVASVAALALLAAFVLIHPSGASPSIAGIVSFAQKGPARPAQMQPPGSDRLAASVEGVRFPYWAKRFGWFANGERSGSAEKRTLTVVYYTDGNRQLSYAIVAGAAFSPSGGHSVSQGGVSYRLLDAEGERTIVWRRGGHTCVLSGHGAADATLLALASWTVAAAKQ
ncbi:MAG: hypothetical protein ACYCU0_05940 [Solirubrobacteraceae bacterium]